MLRLTVSRGAHEHLRAQLRDGAHRHTPSASACEPVKATAHTSIIVHIVSHAAQHLIEKVRAILLYMSIIVPLHMSDAGSALSATGAVAAAICSLTASTISSASNSGSGTVAPSATQQTRFWPA